MTMIQDIRIQIHKFQGKDCPDLHRQRKSNCQLTAASVNSESGTPVSYSLTNLRRTRWEFINNKKNDRSTCNHNASAYESILGARGSRRLWNLPHYLLFSLYADLMLFKRTTSGSSETLSLEALN